MLTLSFIRENKDLVTERLKIKNFRKPELIDKVLEADNSRRSAQYQLDQLQAELNNISRQIGSLIQAGKNEEAERLKDTTSSLKEKIRILSQDEDTLLKEIDALLIQIPNLPHESVPPGQNSASNLL